MKVSSVELTALDLLRYPYASAGLDNIVTLFPIWVKRSILSHWPACQKHSRNPLNSGWTTYWIGWAMPIPRKLMQRELVKKALPS